MWVSGAANLGSFRLGRNFLVLRPAGSRRTWVLDAWRSSTTSVEGGKLRWKHLIVVIMADKPCLKMVLTKRELDLLVEHLVGLLILRQTPWWGRRAGPYNVDRLFHRLDWCCLPVGFSASVLLFCYWLFLF